jgi:hypothetical protein
MKVGRVMRAASFQVHSNYNSVKAAEFGHVTFAVRTGCRLDYTRALDMSQTRFRSLG